MTGFGDARGQDEKINVAVEVRTVNNRYLKISSKCPDAYATLEADIDKLVRKTIARGTVTVVLRIERVGVNARYVVNQPVLEDYWHQLQNLAKTLHEAAPPDLSSLLDLPGAVSENVGTVDCLIRDLVEDAVKKLQAFRLADGRLMQEELTTNCEIIKQQLEDVGRLAPEVVRDYRTKVLDRVGELLADGQASIEPSDLIREVSIFADRCDINEEITRLRSHVDQFAAFIDSKNSMGRKLDFLSQEMFREVNTIGSKGNNVAIAHAVVEMKAAIEKMREILQNIE